MTQHPYDQLSKQMLEELLAPFGSVQRSLEIPGEAKFVDLWFIPKGDSGHQQNWLSRIAQTSCLIEPFRNPPSRHEIRTCLLKLFWVQEECRRKQKSAKILETDLPLLWIIATSITRPVLHEFGANLSSHGVAGIYALAPSLKANLVSIAELPRNRDTLILRILGKGKTQRQAIADTLSLSDEDPDKLTLLRILGNWKVTLELSEIEFEERESIMAFSQAFLEWEQATEQKGIQKGLEQGEKSMILKLLNCKLGQLSAENVSQVNALSLNQLEALGEALLKFKTAKDLQAWLNLQ